MQNINYENLLEREPVDVSLSKALDYVKDKRILITGGGGSIGSELARQLYNGGASRLYIMGHGENSVFKITEELKLRNIKESKDVNIIPVIGDIQDKEYMKYIMKHLQADIVFHTAAHKHVHLMEQNPVEVIKNNVFGTYNVVKAAKEAKVEKLVFISTDKAVEPSCVYGMSKFIAEEIVLNEEDHRFLVVRFGNVIGSKGSFIHTFIKQIENGIPITLTDEKMTRFFMTIPEAVSLILKVGDVGKGGELYHLDMGDPILIKDVAKNLMKLYNKEVSIEIIGPRPGEKTEEKLWSKDEDPEKTRYRGIVRLRKKKRLNNLNDTLVSLLPFCTLVYSTEKMPFYRNKEELKKTLERIF